MLIPLMRPSLFFLFVTQTIGGLQTFTQVYVLTRGGPSDSTTTLVYELYQLAFGNGTADFGRASVIAVFLVLVVAAVAALQFVFANRKNAA
jgi:sn-glycerol 3-phosphate transport system permease protein